MRTEELIGKYAAHLLALNRAERTVKAHAARLARFFDFAERKGVEEPQTVSRALLMEYQGYLAGCVNHRGRRSSVAVQNQHLSVVAGFFKHLVQSGAATHNPADDLQYARSPRRLPKAVLSPEAVRRILREPDLHTLIGFRDRTILEVLYSSGLRRQELLNLESEDVDLQEGFLMVRQGKGGKDRVVPIGKVACRYLETYAAGVRPQMAARAVGTPSKRLFLSARGTPMSRNAVNELVEKYARQAELDVHVSPHAFRHAFATHLVRNRAGIRQVQEMLGHSKLSSTQEYVRLTVTDLKEAHHKYHPRERDRE